MIKPKIIHPNGASIWLFFFKVIRNVSHVNTPFVYSPLIEKNISRTSSMNAVLLKEYYIRVSAHKEKHWTLSPDFIKKRTRKDYYRMSTKFRQEVACKVSHCAYCSVELNHQVRNLPHSSSIDHFVPISKKGTNDESNLRVCCYACNNRKGNINPLTQIKKWYDFCNWANSRKLRYQKQNPLPLSA